MKIQERFDRWFAPVWGLVTGPMPRGALRQIGATEGYFMPEIVVAQKVNGASELGTFALVVEHDAAGNPNIRSKGGAIGANVDPLTPLGALYGAQWVYSQAKRMFTDDMADLGLVVPTTEEVFTWIVIMHAHHSLGRPDFRVLLRRGAKKCIRHPIEIVDHYAFCEMPPRLNRQSPELVRKRLRRMLELPNQAKQWEELPSRISALGPRRPETPVFDKRRAKTYILAERARVAKRPIPPRKADGSPL